MRRRARSARDESVVKISYANATRARPLFNYERDADNAQGELSIKKMPDAPGRPASVCPGGDGPGSLDRVTQIAASPKQA